MLLAEHLLLDGQGLVVRNKRNCVLCLVMHFQSIGIPNCCCDYARDLVVCKTVEQLQE